MYLHVCLRVLMSSLFSSGIMCRKFPLYNCANNNKSLLCRVASFLNDFKCYTIIFIKKKKFHLIVEGCVSSEIIDKLIVLSSI